MFSKSIGNLNLIVMNTCPATLGKKLQGMIYVCAASYIVLSFFLLLLSSSAEREEPDMKRSLALLASSAVSAALRVRGLLPIQE